MIGIELRWLGWDMDITSRCARSKGLLNRNYYPSWSYLSQSDSEQWNEMRGREEWVWGGGEWGDGRCCCWWLLVFCIVPLFIILCVCALWNWFFLFVWRLCVEGLYYRFRDIVFILVLVIMRYFLVVDLVSFEACGGYRSFNMPSEFGLSCRILFASFVLSNIGSCGH